MINALLLEDESLDTLVISRHLRDSGLDINIIYSIALSGALEILRNPNLLIDIVISDLHVIDSDGPDTITALSAETRPKFIPIIVLTSYRQDDFIIKCTKAGASRFLAKGDPPAVLRRSIIAAIAEYELKKEKDVDLLNVIATCLKG